MFAIISVHCIESNLTKINRKSLAVQSHGLMIIYQLIKTNHGHDFMNHFSSIQQRYQTRSTRHLLFFCPIRMRCLNNIHNVGTCVSWH
jgi:hypothetical protein